MVKTPSLIAENGLNIRGYAWDRNPVPSKKSIGWAVSAKVTSRCYYGRRKPIFLEGRMAEWLRSRALLLIMD